MPRPPFPIMASSKTSLWQPTPYLPSQLFFPILPVHTIHIQVLDMHVTVSLTTHSNCHRATIPPLPNKNLHNSLDQSLTMSYSQPLQTYINYSSPNYTDLTNSAPSFCSTWVLWNSTNNFTKQGLFILCRTYAYSCLPLDSLGPCILVFLTPGLTFLKEEEVDQIVYPQGELSHRKRRAVIAPLLIGTGIEAALGTGIEDILTSAHFYYKLSQELNEDMEQVVEPFISVQRQINSLASVALQNRRALDLLTTEKGGTCLFLGEDCCYFVSLMGIVQYRVKELRDRIECCRKVTKLLHSPKPVPTDPPSVAPFPGTIGTYHSIPLI